MTPELAVALVQNDSASIVWHGLCRWSPLHAAFGRAGHPPSGTRANLDGHPESDEVLSGVLTAVGCASVGRAFLAALPREKLKRRSMSAATWWVDFWRPASTLWPACRNGATIQSWRRRERHRRPPGVGGVSTLVLCGARRNATAHPGPASAVVAFGRWSIASPVCQSVWQSLPWRREDTLRFERPPPPRGLRSHSQWDGRSP